MSPIHFVIRFFKVLMYCLLWCSMNFHSTILDRFCWNISTSSFFLLASPFHSNHFSNGLMLLQICYGQVTTVHLYQGAFVNIGCVHEGYVHWILLHDDEPNVLNLAKGRPWRIIPMVSPYCRLSLFFFGLRWYYKLCLPMHMSDIWVSCFLVTIPFFCCVLEIATFRLLSTLGN